MEPVVEVAAVEEPAPAAPAKEAESAPPAAPASPPTPAPAPAPAVAKPLPVRQYLDATVVPTLRAGMRALVKARPEDPSAFLAAYLIEHNPLHK